MVKQIHRNHVAINNEIRSFIQNYPMKSDLYNYNLKGCRNTALHGLQLYQR